MTATIETGATRAEAWQQASTREEGKKTNLRVSNSVASPCCKLLISLNLARAWELAPEFHNPAWPTSHPIQQDKTCLCPHCSTTNGTWGSTTPDWSSAGAWPPRVTFRFEGSRTQRADYLTTRPMSRDNVRSDRWDAPLQHRGGTVRACV